MPGRRHYLEALEGLHECHEDGVYRGQDGSKDEPDKGARLVSWGNQRKTASQHDFACQLHLLPPVAVTARGEGAMARAIARATGVRGPF